MPLPRTVPPPLTDSGASSENSTILSKFVGLPIGWDIDPLLLVGLEKGWMERRWWSGAGAFGVRPGMRLSFSGAMYSFSQPVCAGGGGSTARKLKLECLAQQRGMLLSERALGSAEEDVTERLPRIVAAGRSPFGLSRSNAAVCE